MKPLRFFFPFIPGRRRDCERTEFHRCRIVRQVSPVRDNRDMVRSQVSHVMVRVHRANGQRIRQIRAPQRIKRLLAFDWPSIWFVHEGAHQRKFGGSGRDFSANSLFARLQVHAHSKLLIYSAKFRVSSVGQTLRIIDTLGLINRSFPRSLARRRVKLRK